MNADQIREIVRETTRQAIREELTAFFGAQVVNQSHLIPVEQILATQGVDGLKQACRAHNRRVAK